MKSGAMKVLGDQIRENPELTIGSTEEIIPQVLKGAAYVGVTRISFFQLLIKQFQDLINK